MHYGNSCEFIYPWIGRCEYDGAYELLEHIYGNLKVICSYVPRIYFYHVLEKQLMCLRFIRFVIRNVLAMVVVNTI